MVTGAGELLAPGGGGWLVLSSTMRTPRSIAAGGGLGHGEALAGGRQAAQPLPCFSRLSLRERTHTSFFAAQSTGWEQRPEGRSRAAAVINSASNSAVEKRSRCTEMGQL